MDNEIVEYIPLDRSHPDVIKFLKYNTKELRGLLEDGYMILETPSNYTPEAREEIEKEVFILRRLIIESPMEYMEYEYPTMRSGIKRRESPIMFDEFGNYIVWY